MAKTCNTSKYAAILIALTFVPGLGSSIAQTDGEYAGSQACLECHEDRWTSVVHQGADATDPNCESCHGPGARHAQYEAQDWARDPIRPWMGAIDPGAAESTFLGWRVPDYDVNIFRIVLDYRF